jgi:hypothetical protein
VLITAASGGVGTYAVQVPPVCLCVSLYFSWSLSQKSISSIVLLDLRIDFVLCIWSLLALLWLLYTSLLFLSGKGKVPELLPV